MSGQISQMGATVLHDPRQAKEELRERLLQHNGDPASAAQSYGVTRRTFDRWLVRLGILGLPAEIRAKMGAKGP